MCLISEKLKTLRTLLSLSRARFSHQNNDRSTATPSRRESSSSAFFFSLPLFLFRASAEEERLLGNASNFTKRGTTSDDVFTLGRIR